MVTGGISNLPGYFQDMLNQSVVRLLSGVNRFWQSVSKKCSPSCENTKVAGQWNEMKDYA
jgi:hypothetical protein